jgi:hypothetical protein
VSEKHAERASKVLCKQCQTFDVPGFDKLCKGCGQELGDMASNNKDDETKTAAIATESKMIISESGSRYCLECASEVQESDESCSECGTIFVESTPAAAATPTDDPKEIHCTTCGLDSVQESAGGQCPRCEAPFVLEASDDDEDEDKDDDDEDDEDDEDSDDEDKKKMLFDKEKCEQYVHEPLPPQMEAEACIRMACALDESGIQDLAAHIVWGAGDKQAVAGKPPRFVPEEYQDLWATIAAAGQPKTMISAVHALQGAIVRS